MIHIHYVDENSVEKLSVFLPDEENFAQLFI